MSKYIRRLKNSFNKTSEGEKAEQKQREKEVLALYTKNLSPNQISQYFKETGRMQCKAFHARNILLKNHPRIEKLNYKFDEIASQSISIIEMDETFKGMRYVILVVMDSLTGYIFLVQRILRKDGRHIKKALRPLKDMLMDVKVVLTDGAVYFPNIIQDLCPNSLHTNDCPMERVYETMSIVS